MRFLKMRLYIFITCRTEPHGVLQHENRSTAEWAHILHFLIHTYVSHTWMNARSHTPPVVTLPSWHSTQDFEEKEEDLKLRWPVVAHERERRAETLLWFICVSHAFELAQTPLERGWGSTKTDAGHKFVSCFWLVSGVHYISQTLYSFPFSQQNLLFQNVTEW